MSIYNKNRLAGALGAALLLPLAACGADKAPTPQALFAQVRALENGGALLPGSHLWMHGSRMVDYYTIDRANAIAVRAAAHGVHTVTRFPAGSLYIKENFDIHKVLKTVTAMLKVPGYDRADRDWVMAAYKPNGQVIAYGRVQSCISCHAIAKKTDFTFPSGVNLPIATVQKFFPGQAISPFYRAQLAHLAAPKG
ncbi:cytochrome P460 family protein [Acidiferrobacter sp.]|uniref:cytochrome P460 family protein n=1 Tax=Acidiferrobacter sp. TaxID=1872107 RepID=UPI00260AA6EC|nr:cytochrome P460 family protein [Acidiferrobacter sp.]